MTASARNSATWRVSDRGGRFSGTWSATPAIIHFWLMHIDTAFVTPSSADPCMRVLMVGSEAMPFAKSGGLADVLGALPLALVRLGHQVDVVMPRYRGITPQQALGTVRTVDAVCHLDVPLHATTVDGVRYVFVEHPAYYDRDYLYGTGGHDYPDNPERFALLARAALAWAFSTDVPYDVVHVHDWQAGLVPLLLSRMYRTPRGALPAAVRDDHSQSGLSGDLRRQLAAPAGTALGRDAPRRDGVLGAYQLPQGGHRVQPGDHDRQPALCPGDPDARTGVRLRRHPAAARRRPRRDSERNRLRSVGSGAATGTFLYPSARPIWRGRRRPSGSCSRHTACRRRRSMLRRPLVGDDLEAGGPEGVRSAGRRWPTNCPGWARPSC